MKKADNTAVLDHSIESICDFIIDQKSNIDRFIDHKEFIFDRVTEALLNRSKEQVKSLFNNLDTLL